jgi:hypothetical protein
MAILAAAIMLVIQCSLIAQSMSVPVDIQLELLPKILYLNKALNLEKGDTIKIGIIYNSRIRNSVRVKNEVLSGQKKESKNLQDLESSFIPLDVSTIFNIRHEMKKQKLNAVYLTPIRDYDIEKITEICRSEKIISITSVPQFLEYGVSVGFDLVNNKLKININLASAKEEGANFSSRLLRIAHIIN